MKFKVGDIIKDKLSGEKAKIIKVDDEDNFLPYMIEGLNLPWRYWVEEEGIELLVSHFTHNKLIGFDEVFFKGLFVRGAVVTKIMVNEKKNATTVFFDDNDVIVVKRMNTSDDSLYNAVASAVAIKVHGSNTAFKKTLENVEYINKGVK